MEPAKTNLIFSLSSKYIFLKTLYIRDKKISNNKIMTTTPNSSDITETI